MAQRSLAAYRELAERSPVPLRLDPADRHGRGGPRRPRTSRSATARTSPTRPPAWRSSARSRGRPGAGAGDLAGRRRRAGTSTTATGSPPRRSPWRSRRSRASGGAGATPPPRPRPAARRPDRRRRHRRRGGGGRRGARGRGPVDDVAAQPLGMPADRVGSGLARAAGRAGRQDRHLVASAGWEEATDVGASARSGRVTSDRSRRPPPPCCIRPRTERSPRAPRGSRRSRRLRMTTASRMRSSPARSGWCPRWPTRASGPRGGGSGR